MMSPDPPREQQSDSNREDDVPGVITFFEMIEMDENVMGEGEHELDFSSPESNEDDESGPEDDQPNPIANNGTRARAHYQLLIPFPTGSNPEEEGTNLDSELEFRPAISDLSPEEDNIPDDDPGQIEIVTSTSAQPVRDIQLTPESADVIKNAMKGISLPPASIPEWAKDINFEEVWQKRLLGTVKVKVANNSVP